MNFYHKILINCNQKKKKKRRKLSSAVSIYDPLDILSPGHVLGKVMYSELCDEKIRCPTNKDERHIEFKI